MSLPCKSTKNLHSILLMVLAAIVPMAGAWGELSNSRPNIILVLTDDQGYAQLGCHGHPWLRTPNLDRMYKKSTRLTRFLVSPTCSPTRAALMTGQHPFKVGVTHTILRRERPTLDAVMLPEILKGTDYKTGIFGKWHLGDEEPYQPQSRGFDEVFIHGSGGIGQRRDVPQNSYFDPVIRHNGLFVKTQGYCTDVFFTHALGWIKEQAQTEDPFFAFISTNAAHSPFIAPEKNHKRFERMGFADNNAGFYGMIENLDENMGRLFARLRQWQLMQNTLVIFMSDNGPAHSGSGKGMVGITPEGDVITAWCADLKGGKKQVDEGGCRVPFFMHWPGRIKPGQDIDTIAAHIDLLPTLADLAGALLPADQVEGRSLLPLVEDPDTEWQDRFLFTHLGRWKAGTSPEREQLKKFAIRNQRFRMVGTNELYDMEADPAQTTNVFKDHPEVADAMLHAYEDFWEEARPLMINEEVGEPEDFPYQLLYQEQAINAPIPKWIVPALD